MEKKIHKDKVGVSELSAINTLLLFHLYCSSHYKKIVYSSTVNKYFTSYFTGNYLLSCFRLGDPHFKNTSLKK